MSIIYRFAIGAGLQLSRWFLNNGLLTLIKNSLEQKRELKNQ